MQTERDFAVLKILCVLLLCASLGFARKVQPDRIVSPIDDSQMMTLTGAVHPLAQSRYDRGAVDAALEMPYITLLTKPSDQQRAALEQLLSELQNPLSRNYHRWLTPEQYADRFGLSANDIKALQVWLQSQGFTVVQTARGRNWIAFSGTAAQMESAFHTEIHNYHVNGEKHIANASAPQIPAALGGIVGGFLGLNDFRPRPMGLGSPLFQTTLPILFRPNFTISGQHFLAPDDVATIYNIGQLYTSGYDGSGEKLAIVGQTDINVADIQAFRTGFSLSAINLTQMLYGSDPGHTPDEGEADLDIEWSGAVARNAAITYAYSTNVIVSAMNAINDNLAPVISMSYGACEFDSQPISFLEPFFVQANMQGITFIASSGDSGAAGCDLSTAHSATLGLAVNYPASSPEVTAVGGTEFSEGTGTYWNPTNGSTLASAISYIPEIGWNDSALGGGLASTGGGKSSCETTNPSGTTCTAGFPKPAWQTGTGVPTDGVRDVPDVSLSASASHDGYVLCSLGSCTGGIASGHFDIVGGTSVSAPAFAGLVTILNQFAVSQGILTTPGFGNLNPQLYSMSHSVPGAFHDVTVGSNIVPCVSGTTGCPTMAPFQYGYTAGTGYDLVTGVGSVNAFVFVNSFLAPVSTTTTLTFSPTPVNAGTTVTFTAAVTATSGTTKPGGTVTFFKGSTQLGTGNLNNGTATLSTTSLSMAGNDSITASYGGSASFLASTSSAVSVPVVDFTLASNPTTVSVTRGQSGMVILTITALNNFSAALTYSCSNLPSASSCMASNITTGGATVTISTTAPSASLRSFGTTSGPFYALLLPGCLGVFLVGKKRRVASVLALIFILAISVLWMVACGGGGSSGGGGNPGTPTGAYNVRVTATTGGSSALSHSVPVMLTVQ